MYKKYFETGIFDKNEIKPYMTEGIGEDIIPLIIEFDYIDYVIQVDDKESALETRSLAKDEGLFVGWSWLCCCSWCKKYIKEYRLNDNDVMVIVLPDSGTRYMRKV